MMLKQKVYNRKLSDLQGFFVVMGLVIALIVMNYLVIEVLAKFLSYAAASIGFWVIGILLGLWVFHEFIEVYQYEMDEDILRLSRAYGKRTRLIEDIYLSQLIFVGDPAQAAAKNPGARCVKAYHKKCKIPVTAVVYDSATGKRMALVQANEEFLEALKKKLK